MRPHRHPCLLMDELCVFVLKHVSALGIPVEYALSVLTCVVGSKEKVYPFPLHSPSIEGFICAWGILGSPLIF